MNFAKFLRTLFLKDHLRWLLLIVVFACAFFLNGHYVKSVKIRSFSWFVFSYIRLNTEMYVNLRIQSEYRKIRTRKTPYLDTFQAVGKNRKPRSFAYASTIEQLSAGSTASFAFKLLNHVLRILNHLLNRFCNLILCSTQRFE